MTRRSLVFGLGSLNFDLYLVLFRVFASCDFVDRLC
jgi:hypothetical protein